VKPKQAELFGGRSENYGTLPEGFVFELDFITPAEERALLDEIARLPLAEAKYKQYTARRRIAYFGFGYDFTSNRLGQAPPAPPFLAPLREKVAAWMGVAPAALEQALVTEYRPGTPLGWHRDAPDFGRVAGVSLGGWARMRLRHYGTHEPAANDAPMVLELAPRSAYQMNGAARWRWQHSIPATRELRYSITFRTLRKD
jgi:alkylated DNA repair dioxygenase AlkB